MWKKVRADLLTIGKSFVYTFAGSITLGNIADIKGTRGVTTFLASAALAGGAAALHTFESLFKKAVPAVDPTATDVPTVGAPASTTAPSA